MQNQITVIGGSPRDKRVLTALGTWCLYRLMLPKTAAKIDVQIILDKKLIEEYGSYGNTEIAYFEGNRPTDFIVYLDAKVDTYMRLLTLCHEMVHVWQYATRRLVELQKGDLVSYKRERYSNSMEYRKMPWEIEAFKLEKKLYNEWIACRE